MSNYVGSVGAKVSDDLKLINCYEYTDYKFSYYGTTHYIYTLKDAEGNVYVWKTTALMAMVMKDDSLKASEGLRKDDTYYIRKGDVIHLVGKVKEHSEYKGTKQTVLTRCKVVELVEVAVTEDELRERKAQEQRDSLEDGDAIYTMPYRQYKAHYSDCETVAGSFDNGCDSEGRAVKDPTIEVIVRAGRMKNSGVRGQRFYYFTFKFADGGKATYRAVSELNARKRFLKDYPDAEGWELDTIRDGWRVY